jgi:hypothetical protein
MRASSSICARRCAQFLHGRAAGCDRGRPVYQAVGGYAGTGSITSISKRSPHFRIGAYMRYDTLAGAVFIGSPPVRRRSYRSTGFGISWMIHRSSILFDVPD